MLELYSVPVSLYCAKTRILLRFKGLEWTELPPPGGYGASEYKTIVPSGNLPALRDGDLVVADSEAIAEYIEDRYPDPPALPGTVEARAKCRERSRFHDTRWEPALRTLFPYIPSRAPAPDGFIDQASERLSTLLGQFAAMLRETPDAGSTLTLAECGYPVTFAWIDGMTPVMGLSLDWPAPVLEYRARVMALPAVAAEMDTYQTQIPAFLKP